MSAPIMKRVVGWIDKSEWMNVYEELYSGNPSKQKHALDRIAVWKCRAQNKISTAIECTWELTSAELQYHWAKEEASIAEHDKQLRIIYAMALTRFINLITEKGQNARYAFPVHQLANDLCLPQWMVSLRHDSVHSNLPSLVVLKTGVQTALAWLKVEYWDAVLAEDDPNQTVRLRRDPAVPESETAEMMAQILEAYTAEYFRIYSEKGGPLNRADREPLKPILKDMTDLVDRSNKDVALGVLIQDGFMIHTQDQLEAFGIDTQNLLSTPDLSLPVELLSLWSPVVHHLHSLQFAPLLLTLLLAQDAGTSRPVRLRQAAGWVWEVLTAANRHKGHNKQEYSLTRTFSDTECFTKGRRLLTTCLAHPDMFTAKLLPCLFSTANPPLSKLQEQLLLKSVAVYTNPEGSEMDTGDAGSQDEGCPDADKVNGHDNKTEIHDITQFNIGEKEERWEDCPLGHCPGAPVTYTSLELPETVNNLGSVAHLPLARTPTTPGKGANPHVNGGRSKTRPKEDHMDITLGNGAEWSTDEFNSIKEKITLF